MHTEDGLSELALIIHYLLLFLKVFMLSLSSGLVTFLSRKREEPSMAVSQG